MTPTHVVWATYTEDRGEHHFDHYVAYTMGSPTPVLSGVVCSADEAEKRAAQMIQNHGYDEVFVAEITKVRRAKNPRVKWEIVEETPDATPA